ncbi:MAG: tetratricopeptide repeat protein [Chloracidobacterium sp.]|nr:tetratricopeptide repeat protein [Chloracidobacterium sp.]
MKRCPECRRDYYDDTLLYCLDDGNELLEGPTTGSAGDEPVTAIFHSTASSDDAPTRAQIHTTEQTAVLPSGIADIPKTKAFDKRLFLALVLLAVIVLGGFFGYRYVTPGKQIESIAVMPFINESGNADVEYLSDGMTETLIGNLTQLPNLNVKARSSVFRYKGKETDAKTIGKELNVQAILNGRVAQRGDQLTLSLELVDVQTENAIWSQRYDRKQADLVSLQSEIARDVSSKLKSRLSGAEVASVEKNYTANSEAYQLYLQGRYQWNKREAKAFDKAVEFFKQAIEKDPNYALAYSGLADTYSLFPAYGYSRPKDYMPQAKQAALKALELDPNLAEAHASLGEAIFYYDYDWAGAEKAFKRAIELNPKYATAHQWYAELLDGAGKHDDAIREISKAVELDPFSKIINQQMVQILTVAKRFDEALMQNKKVNELFPDEIGFRYTNATIYEAQGKYSQAFEEYILVGKAARAKPEEIQEAKDMYEKGGWDGLVKNREEEKLKSLNDQQAKDKNAYVQAIEFANSYAYLKDKDKTIEYLNKAYDERSMGVLYLKVSFIWDFVRDDARFKELVKRVGIPE